MPDPSPRDRALVDSVYETNGDFLPATDHVDDAGRPSAHDARLAEVAAATGHSIHTVHIRGAGWCQRNPIRQRDEFDQTLPDSFDTDVVEANAADADALIAAARRVRAPAAHDALAALPTPAKILPNGAVLFTMSNGIAYAVKLSDGALAITAHTPDAAPAALAWEEGDGLNGWLRLHAAPTARRAA